MSINPVKPNKQWMTGFFIEYFSTNLKELTTLCFLGKEVVVKVKLHSLAKLIWKYRVAYFFVAPSLILLFGLIINPLFQSFRYSFYDWDGILPPVYVGFENYQNLFQEGEFWASLKNNLIFTSIVTTSTVILGFLFAVAIDRRLKGWKTYKFVFYIPVMISMTIVAILFQKIYEPTHGILNSFFGLIGLDFLQQAWLGDPNIALYSVIASAIWQHSGFTMLLLLTAIEGISPEIHDAATIDGVNGYQRITRITFPLVKRVVFVVTMIQIIYSFKVFDKIYVMTGGGPGNATQVLATYLYKTAFGAFKFGYGSAIAVMMTFFVFTFSLIYLYFSRLGQQESD
jgi:raffinose/stachyose/melibiose transport system permease protein